MYVPSAGNGNVPLENLVEETTSRSAWYEVSGFCKALGFNGEGSTLKEGAQLF